MMERLSFQRPEMERRSFLRLSILATAGFVACPRLLRAFDRHCRIEVISEEREPAVFRMPHPAGVGRFMTTVRLEATAKTTVISVRAIHECAEVRQTRTWNVTPVRMVRGDSLEVTIRTTAEVAAGRPPAHVESYL